MAYNKVVYGSNVLIDLTADTVAADKLLDGITAHGADGEVVTGTCEFDASTADATAGAEDILNGKTAYASASEIAAMLLIPSAPCAARVTSVIVA